MIQTWEAISNLGSCNGRLYYNLISVILNQYMLYMIRVLLKQVIDLKPDEKTDCDELV